MSYESEATRQKKGRGEEARRRSRQRLEEERFVIFSLVPCFS
jgi:hypothetical protein